MKENKAQIKKSNLLYTTATLMTLRAAVGIAMAASENRANNPQTPPVILLFGPLLSLLIIAAFGVAQGKRWGINLGLGITLVTTATGSLGVYNAINKPNQELAGPALGGIMSLVLIGWLLLSGVRQATK